MNKFVTMALVLIVSVALQAQEKIKMSFNQEELGKIIETYSKASGQKFVFDPSVRGKATILIDEPVSVEEAFNQLSTALAINGYAISKQGDTMVIMSARNAQRNLIEVGTDLPALKPERMYTWIVSLKNASAADINREVRILTSRDGELVAHTRTNQLIITDWVSNLHRLAPTLKELDRKVEPEIAKIAATAEKNDRANMKKMKEASSKQAPAPAPAPATKE